MPMPSLHRRQHHVPAVTNTDPISSLCTHAEATFIGVFCMWRFLLGIGIGGDYPLSAVITSEYTPQNIRGSMMACVFAMQGVGYMAAAIVSTVVLACFQGAISDVSRQCCHACSNACFVSSVECMCCVSMGRAGNVPAVLCCAHHVVICTASGVWRMVWMQSGA